MKNFILWYFRMAKRATALAVAPTQSRHADTMTDQFSDLGNAAAVSQIVGPMRKPKKELGFKPYRYPSGRASQSIQ
jgi:hypothetical protein